MAEWLYYNPNPRKRRTGDCVIRAVCAATGKSWDEVFWGAAFAAFGLDDMPSSNIAWRLYLRSLGYKRREVTEEYTVGEFADDHPHGVYVLGTGSHAVTARDGRIYDTFDSRPEPVLFYYYKE